MSEDLSYLSSARYGKDKVRVFRVVREGSCHRVVEYNVTVLVEGDIDTSYTKADNSVVVATDSIKNVTYYLAKVSPHVLIPERFALHLGTHLVSKYAHLHKVFITIEQLRWSRIPISGKEHHHSFLRDGDEKRVIKVEVDASKGKDKIEASVTSGISDLLVLKSTGSAFTNFVRDEYTTLVEVDDRIFSTSIDLTYRFAPLSIPAPTDEKKLEFIIPKEIDGQDSLKGGVWDVDVPGRARKVTLEVFAEDDSASVQATLYKMAQKIIQENKGIQSVSYALPNKHYIPVDMKYIGVDNTTPLSVSLFVLFGPFFASCFGFFVRVRVFCRFSAFVLATVLGAFVPFVLCLSFPPDWLNTSHSIVARNLAAEPMDAITICPLLCMLAIVPDPDSDPVIDPAPASILPTFRSEARRGCHHSLRHSGVKTDYSLPGLPARSDSD